MNETFLVILPAPNPVVHCDWCGRAVLYWDADHSPDDQLCARCLEMVRDPDRRKPDIWT